MSNSRGLKEKLAAVSKLWKAKEFDKALAEVETLLETWPGNAHLHVLRASLMQLHEKPEYSLADIKQALQEAVELDKGSPAAAIELGHFLDNVEDNPQAAAKAYAEGLAIAWQLLVDALIGQAKAYRQLDKGKEFKRCRLQLKGLQLVWDLMPMKIDERYLEQIQDLLNEPVADRTG
jgi:hypothetical protein